MTDSEKLDLIINKVDSMETKMDSMETKMDSLEVDLKDVKLTIENEISRNIKIIAEGHLDLSRNLHEAMKPSNALEMVMVQVNILESKVRELEKQVQKTA